MVRKKAESLPFTFFHGILGLIFLNLILFGDILLNGRERVLSSPRADLYLHFVAWRQFAFDQLRQGHLPLWNPHYLCGAPFLGNFESALLYPPNWLYLILPLGLAINLGIVLHVFLAGLFTYLWASKRGLYPLAAFVAGTVFMWGGPYFLHVFAGHLPNLCAMAWAPLLFLIADDLLEKTALGTTLIGIFAVSMQILAGHPQYVYFTALIFGAYLLLNLPGKKAKGKILAGVFAIYAGAALVTAAQLWTGVQALLECGRNIPLDYHAAASFSFPPENLITTILPEFFGNLNDSPYWGRWFLWEVSFFIGITAFWLALIAVTHQERKKIFPILFTGIIAWIFSLGAFTPLYRVFYQFIPGINELRGISKFGFLFGLILAVLAGHGLDGLIKRAEKPDRLKSLLWVAGSLMGTVGTLIFISIPKGLQGGWGRWFSSLVWLKQTFQSWDPVQQRDYLEKSGLHASYSLWVGGGTCFLLALFVHLLEKSRRWIYAIAALSVIELFIFARSNRPTFEMAALQKKFSEIQKLYQQDPGEYRVYGTASASLATGGHDIWEDEPMVLGRYGRFVCYSQGLSENQLFSVLPIFQRFHPIFRMMRLKYRVFSDREPVQWKAFPFKPLPRMLLVDQWEVVPDGQKILPALFDPKFDPTRKVYLEQDPGLAPSSGPDGFVHWKDLSTDETVIDVETPKDCLLFITDNFSSGWRVEGLSQLGLSQRAVIPANYFLTAIPLKAGKHQFVLGYRPMAFSLGKWVSILSTLLYVGILWATLRRKIT